MNYLQRLQPRSSRRLCLAYCFSWGASRTGGCHARRRLDCHRGLTLGGLNQTEDFCGDLAVVEILLYPLVQVRSAELEIPLVPTDGTRMDPAKFLQLGEELEQEIGDVVELLE